MKAIDKDSFQSKIFKWIFVLIVFTSSVFVLLNPLRFWDMLPYMGSVVSIDKNDPGYIHTTTYSEFNRFASQKMKSSMIEGHTFCKDLSISPDKFYQQLPFFKIKMLYVYLSWVFYKMGVPLFYAVLLPGVISFIGIGLLLYMWLQKFFIPPVVFIASVLFAVFNLNFDAFRIASPDAMAAFFLLMGAYFYLEKSMLKRALPFFMLAILTRVDYIFFIVTLLGITLLFPSKNELRQRLYALGGIAVSVILLLFVRWQSGNYDAYRMFYRSFVYLTETPQSDQIVFITSDYLEGIKSGLKASLHNTIVYIIPILLIIFYVLKKMRLSKIENTWIISMFISFIARVFIHPLFETRYLFVFIIVLIVMIVAAIQNRMPNKWRNSSPI